MDEPKDFTPQDMAEDVPPEWEEALLSDGRWDERDEQALANLDAGKFITHEAMMRWLRSLGTEHELPPGARNVRAPRAEWGAQPLAV